MSFPDPSPKLGDSDNNLLFKIAQMISSGALGVSQAQVDASIAADNTSDTVAIAAGDAATLAAALAADAANAAAFAVADLYVNETGDTMTGALAIGNGTVAANAPVLSLSQTWNNAAVVFSGATVNVVNTASGAGSSLLSLQESGNEKLRVEPAGLLYITRQVADNAPEIIGIQKRGTTGDVNGAVSSGDNYARIDFRGWNGSAFVGGATILAQALNTFSGSANGTSLLFTAAATGTTSSLTRMTLTSDALNFASGTAIRLNGVALLNPLSVFAAGTAYTLTAVSAGVDFGTTDPILTINAVGTYRISATVQVELVGATFAANQTLTVKLRRTNNTAADVANSTVSYTVPITTTLTQTLAIFDLPEVPYTTALTTDTIQIFADVSATPSAGSITIRAASIFAFRTS